MFPVVVDKKKVKYFANVERRKEIALKDITKAAKTQSPRKARI